MSLTWRDIFAVVAIIAAFVGFAILGPGNSQNIAQAIFYIASVIYFIMLFRRLRRGKSTTVT